MENEVDLASVLSDLATQVRTLTVHCLRTAEASILRWVPPGLSSHVLWHAGHAVWVVDALTVAPITGQSELPAGWEAMFGESSQPASQTSWPEREEVATLLELQLDRVLTLFVDPVLSISRRAKEIPPNSDWPLLTGILHGWHDEARHHGQMHLLAKLYQSIQSVNWGANRRMVTEKKEISLSE